MSELGLLSPADHPGSDHVQGEGSVSPAPSERLPTARDIDIIYKETDRLYYRFAHGCGLSDSAFWLLVSAAARGGRVTQHEVAEDYSYSRQTVNSATKALEARGLVSLSFEEGSRRSKVIVLTPVGQDFCRKSIDPAIEAERRAFDSLSPADRRAFVRIVRAYTDAIDAELSALARSEGGGA